MYFGKFGFYGIQVQLIPTDRGIPVAYYIVPDSQADVKGLRSLPLFLAEGSKLYADAASTDYNLEDLLSEEGMKLHSQRKSNASRKDTSWLAYIQRADA